MSTKGYPRVFGPTSGRSAMCPLKTKATNLHEKNHMTSYTLKVPRFAINLTVVTLIELSSRIARSSAKTTPCPSLHVETRVCVYHTRPPPALEKSIKGRAPALGTYRPPFTMFFFFILTLRCHQRSRSLCGQRAVFALHSASRAAADVLFGDGWVL
ncbi:CYFA0S05e02751g1_1 [Cyberlindnera fabianii]|uniref:CYFA0S05e02751g1_1 n=1 Tax=Cyberlindnera fabianii TaxID=36022 RepID=A0A061AZ26_CYBFA|nr:CYFA0S05e02751g1_1 [Cyberlindnera fabianii]